jgi:hypothetical protein
MTATSETKGDSVSAGDKGNGKDNGNGRITLGAYLKELRSTPAEQCPEGGWPLLPPEAFRFTPEFQEKLYKP